MSTCRPLSSSPPREQLCNRSCSNKHTQPASRQTWGQIKWLSMRKTAPHGAPRRDIRSPWRQRGPGSGGRGWRALRCARCLRGRSGAQPRRGLRFGRERQRRMGVRGVGGGVGGSVLAGRGWWASGCALLLCGRGAACGQRGLGWRAALSRSLARSLVRSLSLSLSPRIVRNGTPLRRSSLDKVGRVNPPRP